ncbi:MAG: FAD-binding oxidoreductase [Microlunatus sp.]|nr:FAD-binding oxidoreductase [Microlunatus sp.]
MSDTERKTTKPRTMITPGPRSGADVVVIGGGIVGCMTALELAKSGIRPVVVEKGAIGNEQSSRNWGYIRQQGRADAEIPLMVEARDTWASFEEYTGSNIGWRESGNLRLLENPQDVGWYRDWAVKGRAHDIPVEILQPEAISTLLPGSRGDWLAATYTPTDGQVDPVLATQATAAMAGRLGAVILPDTVAHSILVRRGKVIGVATQQGMIATESVVIAAGVWTRRLLADLGINLPLQWVRLTAAETGPVDGFPDIPTVWSRDVSFRRTQNGGLLFAGSSRADIDVMPSALNNVGHFLSTFRHNRQTFRLSVGKAAFRDLRTRLGSQARYAGWEPTVNARSVKRSFEALGKIYPELTDVPVARSWAGYVDGTPDNLPVLSCVSAIEGLVVGGGSSGHGFGTAPASGRILSDLVRSGVCERHDVSPFDLARFQSADFTSATTIAR